MIEASQFVDLARARGFAWYAGVPCSFLTPFINYVIDSPSLKYLAVANEGDAVAAAAGASIGGAYGVAMMQNSGLGNAVSPLTSLTHIFRIPILIICTHRGAPGVHDEPQHELMGTITEQLFDIMQIPWETFPQSAEALPAALDRALAHFAAHSRPYALLMQKGTVADYALQSRAMPTAMHAQSTEGTFGGGNRLSRAEVLRRVVELTPRNNSLVLASTGFCGRELYAVDDRPNQLYMVGSMGCISSLGLGLALTKPKTRVVVLDGDGAALMRMGNFASVGSYGAQNFVHILLDNEAHDSTGAQATVARNVDFAEIARACGYAHVFRGDSLSTVSIVLANDDRKGPSFVHLKIKTGTVPNLPRPSITPPEVLKRLRAHMETQG